MSSILSYIYDPQTILVFLTSLLLSYWLLKPRHSYKSLPGPPALPLLGNLIAFAIKTRYPSSPFRVVNEWRAQYGDIYRMMLGSQQAVVISGYQMVSEALREKQRAFDARGPMHVPDTISKRYGIVSSNGKLWKETRKFTSVALREMGVGKKSLEEHLQEEAGFLIDAFEAEKGAFYPRILLFKAASNAILRVCFGERSDYHDQEFGKIVEAVDFILLRVATQCAEDFWPWLQKFPVSRTFEAKEADEVARDFVMRQLTIHKSTFDDEHVRDFADLHLKRRQVWQDEHLKSDFHMCRTILDLLYASSDTSVAYTSALLLHMVRYPDIQAKCQQEIDEVVGSGHVVSLSDESKLVYTKAVMNEVLRRYTVAPLGLPRAVVKDVELGGYLLPKGAIAIFNLYSVHHDEDQWGPDADVFKPERWITENGQLRKYDAFMPFGLGTRRCIGEPFAKMEDFIFFTNALHKLTFKLPDGAVPPDMYGIQVGIVQIPKPYHVVCERRQQNC